MKRALAIGTTALVLAAVAAADPAPPCADCTLKDKPTATLDKTKPTAAPAPNPLAKMSDGFWGDWKATEKSESFHALKAAVTETQAPTAAPAAPAAPPTAGPPPPQKQKIVDVAVTKPETAAKLLTAASAASDSASTNALATVVTMTTPPQTLAEAAPLVAPEAQASAETFRANLSTGIPGLPGIYLGDSPSVSSARAEAPSGYTPVSGGSAGCPAR